MLIGTSEICKDPQNRSIPADGGYINEKAYDKDYMVIGYPYNARQWPHWNVVAVQHVALSGSLATPCS